MLGFFIDFLFPKHCVHCKRFGRYLCYVCQSKIELLTSLICPMCERPAVDGVTHPGCQTRYSLDGLISFFRYDGPVKAAIKRLKYKPYLAELAEILLDAKKDSGQARMTSFWGAQATPESVVIPVPLHPQRERKRGFNQAALLAKAIGEKLELQFTDGVLKRTRNTKPQVELKGKERRENVVNAFQINTNFKFQISNFKFLLIDDVWTTGSTLRTCANILKRAGAKKVWAMTIAR